MTTNIRRISQELAALNMTELNDVFMLDYDDEDLSTLHAVIKAPVDSLYAFRFIRLTIQIPEDYPFRPPKLTFHNHTSNRVHPNLYSKVCLSILNTWPGNPWRPSLTIETVLRTIQSLLDHEPYTHEPGQSNNEPYNKWVDYCTWDTLFLSYFENETRPNLSQYMLNHAIEDASRIKNLIKHKQNENIGFVPYSHDAKQLDWVEMKRKIKSFLSDYE